MKKLKLLICALSIFSIVSCNVENSSNEEPNVLDLRIKKNGNVSTTRTTRNNATVNPDGSVQTTHVKAEAVTGGILFTITKPTDATYDDGFGYVAIYREEAGVRTTYCVLPWGVTSYEPILYPFCEPGESYDFLIQIESTYSNDNGRVDQYIERMTITATDGIGDIDYSNVNDKQWLTASQNGSDTTVNLVDCIPPEAANVVTYVSYFEGDRDWSNPNTKWVKEYTSNTIEFNVTETGLIDDLTSRGVTQFFAQYSFQFTLDAYPQFAQIRTMTLDSNIVNIQ